MIMRILDLNELVADVLGRGSHPVWHLPWHSSDNFSLHDIVSGVVRGLPGKAELLISSFSISDDAVFVLQDLVDDGLIKELSLVLNVSMQHNKFETLYYAANLFEGVYLTENHSKLVILKQGMRELLFLSSSNMSASNNIEAGIVTNDVSLIWYFEALVKGMILNSEKVINT